jgi:hypothetical protein
LRGVFQTVFLSHLQNALGQPLNEVFDLVAGTSTGAIVGLGLANGVEPGVMTELFQKHGAQIFSSGLLSGFRRGPRYDSTRLRETLAMYLGPGTMSQLPVDVLIPASSIERFEGHLFTRSDHDLPLVDVALASAAAPTYFAPVVPAGKDRAYWDGGLWANDPTVLSILHAHLVLHRPLPSLRVLAVGTGMNPAGISKREAERIRTYSPHTVSMILESMMGPQTWFAKVYGELLVSERHLVHINTRLTDRRPLDDVRALVDLPPLAERKFEERKEAVLRLMREETGQPEGAELSAVLSDVLSSENITGFFPGRKYYATRGAQGSRIDGYVATAKKSVVMISVNLMTGLPFDDITAEFGRLVRRSPPVKVTVSLLDPSCTHIMKTVAPTLGGNGATLAANIRDSLEKLRAFKLALPARSRNRFIVRTHKMLPGSSAILLDHSQPEGRIQLETKPYRSGLQQSFAFEVAAGSEFYKTLVDSYVQLLADSD